MHLSCVVKHTACALLLLLTIQVALQAGSQPADALQKADHYSDLYNWIDSAPFYQAADSRLPKRTPAEWPAHIGYLRATMETRSLPELSNYLANLLLTAPFTSDLRLRLWCLGIKGDADGEMDSSSARADWQEAYTVAKQLNDKKWQSRALAEVGFEAYLQGDIATGRRNVAGATIVAHTNGDVGAEIRYLSAIGTGLAWNHAYTEAHSYFERALALAKNCPDCGYPYLTVAGQIETFLGERDYKNAQWWTRDSINHSFARGKAIKLTQAMLFDADIALGRHQVEGAIQILLDTIKLAKHNQTKMLGDAEMKLADIYLQQQNLAVAERYADAALSHTSLTNDLFTAPARLEFTAHLEWALGHQQKAQQRISRALDVAEGLLAHTSNEPTREGLLTQMSSAYVTAFTYAAKQNQLERAYSTIERVRGRITSEMIESPGPGSNSQEDSSLEDTIRNLKIKLIKAGTEPERQSLINSLFYAEQQRYTIDTGSLSRRKYTIIPLKDVESSLRPDEVMVEYVLPETGSAYCLAISNNAGKIIALGDAKQVSGVIHAYLEEMQSGQWKSETARALYKSLLLPIPDIQHFRRLTIVPDGILHLLPFDTLITNQGNLLVNRVVLDYAPSALSYHLLRSRPTPLSQPHFLGVGAVIYNRAATEKFSLAKNTSRGAFDGVDFAKLTNLPGSRDEVNTAADLIDPQHAIKQLDKSATEYDFIHAPLSTFEVVHLAVHAISNEKDPSRAALVFPPDPEHGQDGMLEPQDILNLRFNAKVVVLSACATSVGRLQGQVGVANVARAFLQAGAASVVSTLWPVDDSYSLALMKLFYRHFASGEDVATALTLAKRDMFVSYGNQRSPVLWAAFIVLGNRHAKLSSQPVISARSFPVAH